MGKANAVSITAKASFNPSIYNRVEPTDEFWQKYTHYGSITLGRDPRVPIEISIKNYLAEGKLPQWVTTSTTYDDKNETEVINAKKTFGLERLIQAIGDSFGDKEVKYYFKDNIKIN